MSKPKHYWYGIARKMCMRYYKLLDWKSMQEFVFLNAINRSLSELEQYPDATDRHAAIEYVLFLQRGSIVGAAHRLHYSEATIQRWINQFVNTVGRNAGFK